MDVVLPLQLFAMDVTRGATTMIKPRLRSPLLTGDTVTCSKVSLFPHSHWGFLPEQVSS